VLPYYAMMEQEELVTRAERIGIYTTDKGTMKMVTIMTAHYQKEIEGLIGHTIFNEILKKFETS